MNEISALTRKDIRKLVSPLSAICHVRIQCEESHLQTRKWPLPDTSVGTFTNVCCLSHSACGIFVTVAQAKTKFMCMPLREKGLP